LRPGALFVPWASTRLTSKPVSAGTFNVYFNSNPNGDWSNPASFSSGQLIATFARKESLFPEFGPIAFHSLSESLSSSHRMVAYP